MHYNDSTLCNAQARQFAYYLAQYSQLLRLEDIFVLLHEFSKLIFFFEVILLLKYLMEHAYI